MSQRAETDQRYYAVTSAVELLCDDFKGKTVTVEYSREVKATPVAISDTDLTITDNEFESDNPIVAAVTKNLVLKLANSTVNSTTVDDTYSLTVTGAPEKSTLGCIIKEYVKTDGRVIFEVSNTTSETSSAVYTLQVVFDANVNTSSSQYKKSATDSTLMEKVSTTLVWSLNSIKKGAVTET